MRNKTFKIIEFVFVLSLFVIGIFFILRDWKTISQIPKYANWWLLLVALVFTFASYFFASVSFAYMAKMFGINMCVKDLFTVGLISFGIGGLVSLGGLSFYTLRVIMMKKHGARALDAIALSIIHGYFGTIAMFFLFPISILFLLSSDSMPYVEETHIIIAFLVLILLFILLSFFIFFDKIRTKIFEFIGSIFIFINNYTIHHSLKKFEKTFRIAINIIKKKKIKFLNIWYLIAAERITSIFALVFCFFALGVHIKIGALITAFCIGMIVTFFSFIPGGLGLQEGSMSFIFSQFGVPIGTAILISMLFRVIYYVIPFFVCFWLYKRLYSFAPKIKNLA